MPTNWKDEFSAEYQPEKVVLDLLTIYGVDDMSWHNDAAPKFGYYLSRGGEREPRVELWFEHPDYSKREMQNLWQGKRYLVCVSDDYGDTSAEFFTNDADAAVKRFIALTTLPVAVGDKFANLLSVELSPDEYRQVQLRNKTETHEGCCHSHDFCDANMVMAEAIKEAARCEPSFDNDAVTELWNQAWDYAKAQHLTAKR